MVELRCASCSHVVGQSVEPMRLVGLFKSSLIGRVGRTNAQEMRKRCPSCGWVNVFHPQRVLTRMEIELKV